MVIDATEQFAKRTAQFLLTNKLTRVDVALRLKQFPQTHVELIASEINKIKAK